MHVDTPSWVRFPQLIYFIATYIVVNPPIHPSSPDFCQRLGILGQRPDIYIPFSTESIEEMPTVSKYPALHIPNVDIWDFVFSRTNAKYLVAHPELLSVVTVVRKGAISVSHILLLGDKNTSQQTRFRYFLSLPSPHPVFRPKINPQSSVTFLVYSSGTTGKPKGVMLTHKNIISNIMMLTKTYNGNISLKGQSGRGDSMIGFLPFFHSYGELVRLLESVTQII
jgi:hypothetical protein